jgi:hypothetical protein
LAESCGLTGRCGLIGSWGRSATREFDLRTFPDEASGQIVALQDFEELDRYTDMVAGWTDPPTAYYTRRR